MVRRGTARLAAGNRPHRLALLVLAASVGRRVGRRGHDAVLASRKTRRSVTALRHIPSRDHPARSVLLPTRENRYDRQVTARDALREEVGKGAQGQADRAQRKAKRRGADAAADAPAEAGRLTSPPAGSLRLRPRGWLAEGSFLGGD